MHVHNNNMCMCMHMCMHMHMHMHMSRAAARGASPHMPSLCIGAPAPARRRHRVWRQHRPGDAVPPRPHGPVNERFAYLDDVRFAVSVAGSTQSRNWSPSNSFFHVAIVHRGLAGRGHKLTPAVGSVHSSGAGNPQFEMLRAF